jgi:predicted DNA-binding transcriptional regulator AlpA
VEGLVVTSNHPPAQDNPTMEDSIMTEHISLLDDQLVDMRFITKLTGLTDKWFYKLIKDGLFPKPIKLGRSSRWKQSEIEGWLQQRIADSRGH